MSGLNLFETDLLNKFKRVYFSLRTVEMRYLENYLYI